MAEIEFRLPELGEGVYEAELVEWLVEEGDQVEHGQDLAEVMTDKATMELPAPFAGRIVRVHFQAGDLINVGDLMLSYETGADEPPREEGPGTLAETTANGRQKRPAAGSGEPRPPSREVRAAPAVRRIAGQLGVDLSQVSGSGPEGRILIGDLAAAVESRAAAAPSPAPSPGSAPQETPAAIDTSGAIDTPLQETRTGSRIKLRGLRRKIAEHVAEAKRTIPHFTYVDQCNVTELVRLRESLKDQWRQQGVKLTYLAFFVKAAAAALQEHPLINSRLNEETNEILLHDQFHIGIAVNTPDGLIVPVVHRAEQLDVRQIAREIDRLSTAARAGQLTLHDLRDGTFTITSIGNVGGLISTPIINHPQVAIMGVGKIDRRPVYDDAGNLAPADMLYLSFSFDHRVVDGAVGAEFSNTVIRRLQQIVTEEEAARNKEGGKTA